MSSSSSSGSGGFPAFLTDANPMELLSRLFDVKDSGVLRAAAEAQAGRLVEKVVERIGETQLMRVTDLDSPPHAQGLRFAQLASRCVGQHSQSRSGHCAFPPLSSLASCGDLWTAYCEHFWMRLDLYCFSLFLAPYLAKQISAELSSLVFFSRTSSRTSSGCGGGRGDEDFSADELLLGSVVGKAKVAVSCALTVHRELLRAMRLVAAGSFSLAQRLSPELCARGSAVCATLDTQFVRPVLTRVGGVAEKVLPAGALVLWRGAEDEELTRHREKDHLLEQQGGNRQEMVLSIPPEVHQGMEMEMDGGTSASTRPESSSEEPMTAEAQMRRMMQGLPPVSARHSSYHPNDPRFAHPPFPTADYQEGGSSSSSGKNATNPGDRTIKGSGCSTEESLILKSCIQAVMIGSATAVYVLPGPTFFGLHLLGAWLHSGREGLRATTKSVGIPQLQESFDRLLDPPRSKNPDGVFFPFAVGLGSLLAGLAVLGHWHQKDSGPRERRGPEQQPPGHPPFTAGANGGEAPPNHNHHMPQVQQMPPGANPLMLPGPAGRLR